VPVPRVFLSVHKSAGLGCTSSAVDTPCGRGVVAIAFLCSFSFHNTACMLSLPITTVCGRITYPRAFSPLRSLRKETISETILISSDSASEPSQYGIVFQDRFRNRNDSRASFWFITLIILRCTFFPSCFTPNSHLAHGNGIKVR